MLGAYVQRSGQGWNPRLQKPWHSLILAWLKRRQVMAAVTSAPYTLSQKGGVAIGERSGEAAHQADHSAQRWEQWRVI